MSNRLLPRAGVAGLVLLVGPSLACQSRTAPDIVLTVTPPQQPMRQPQP
jgi:hypothetical protein